MNTTPSIGQRLTFPGPELRPIPSFSVTCPTGWSAGEAPGSVAALREEASSGPFTANVVVSVDRVDATITLADAVAATLEEARTTLPDLRLENERVLEVDALPAHARVYSLDEPRIAQRVTQLIVTLLLPPLGDGSTCDLVQITCSCASDDAERQLAAFEEIVMSFELHPDR